VRDNQGVNDVGCSNEIAEWIYAREEVLNRIPHVGAQSCAMTIEKSSVDASHKNITTTTGELHRFMRQHPRSHRQILTVAA